MESDAGCGLWSEMVKGQDSDVLVSKTMKSNIKGFLFLNSAKEMAFSRNEIWRAPKSREVIPTSDIAKIMEDISPLIQQRKVDVR